MKPVDIGPEIQAICNKLGIPDRKWVGRLNLLPMEAEAMVYLRNEVGEKYWDPEQEAVAVQWHSFKVRT